MAAFNQFLTDHWFLAWCALWLGWGACWVAVVMIEVGFRVFNRIMRTINIAIRGWPPTHLDADGDWKEKGS